MTKSHISMKKLIAECDATERLMFEEELSKALRKVYSNDIQNR